MAVDLSEYGLSAGAQLGQGNLAQQRAPDEDRLYRSQALHMAIEHHKNCGHGDVAEMAAKFLAFLKGSPDV